MESNLNVRSLYLRPFKYPKSITRFAARIRISRVCSRSLDRKIFVDVIKSPTILIDRNGRYAIKYKIPSTKPNMSKQQYRADIGIISEILSVTMDCGQQGAIISAISRRANLSHYAVIEKCQRLTDAGLLESTSNNKNHTFIITEKGVQFFHQLQKFIETVQEIKIRY